MEMPEFASRNSWQGWFSKQAETDYLKMLDHKIGGLPVVEATAPAGDGMRLLAIITETDLLGCLVTLLEQTN